MKANNLRWRVAALQTGTAALLLYWHHVQYERALQVWNAISIWDYWSIASGLLIILDLPAIIIAGPFALLFKNEYVLDALFLCNVFIFWFWVATPFSPRIQQPKAISSKHRGLSYAIAGVVAIGAALFVPSTLAWFVKVAAALFWGTVAFAFYRAKIIRRGLATPY